MFAGLEKMYGAETKERFGFSNDGRRWYVSRTSHDGLGDIWDLVYATPCGLIMYNREDDEWDGCPWGDVYRVAVDSEVGWHLVYKYKADEWVE